MRAITASLLALLVLLCVACAPVPPAPVEFDDWVIVTYGTEGDRFATEAFYSLIPTELAAHEASGLGYIDGNEVGNFEYVLYFIGSDRFSMWEVLEPILADAPVPSASVELRDGLDDPIPTVMLEP